MLVVVSYDVSTKTPAGEKRLRTMAKLCIDNGMRVQNSVFECIVDPAQWTMFKHKLLSIYNEKEDSLRFYFLGANWTRRIEHHGTKEIPNIMSDALIL
jgi:CRISPR-associated protein Cas2